MVLPLFSLNLKFSGKALGSMHHIPSISNSKLRNWVRYSLHCGRNLNCDEFQSPVAQCNTSSQELTKDWNLQGCYPSTISEGTSFSLFHSEDSNRYSTFCDRSTHQLGSNDKFAGQILVLHNLVAQDFCKTPGSANRGWLLDTIFNKGLGQYYNFQQ